VKGLIAWFARNGVAANLLMLVVIAGGLLTAPHIRQEVFPELSVDRVTVSVVYPGSTPAEVEDAINVRVEERIAGLEGIKKITSTAAEGAGAVTVEALPGVETRDLLDDVKAEVDAIDTFPDEAEEPVVRELVLRRHVISVAIYGDTDESTLKHIGERVRDDLTALPDISQVTLANTRPYEVSVEISESALRRYGLTFDDVSDAVRRSSLDLPAGSVKTDAGEVLLRTQAQAYFGREFERIVVRTRPDGTRLLLSDVATVVDGFEDTGQFARFDGKPAVMVEVFRVGEQSALRIAAAVKEYVESRQATMPPGVSLTTWDDNTRVLRGRLDTLRRNGLQGLVLVFLTLALFLQFRLALWTTVGIPVSFLGTLWLMPSIDVSINVLSLFSFILVLGIIVDDAIVVGENVYKNNEMGMSGYEAVVRGTQEVAIPVIFGVLTTVAVFVPMLTLPGTMGKIMRVFPSIVIPTLLFSLVESQLVLPSHLKHVIVGHKVYTNRIAVAWKRVQARFAAGLAAFISRVYRPGLAAALEWRYTVAAIAVVVVIVTGAMGAAGWIRVRFFPDVEADNVIVALTMPQGTPEPVTVAALGRIEKAVDQLRSELDGRMKPGSGPAIAHMMTSVGEQPTSSAQSHGNTGGRSYSGSHLAEINLQLAPAEDRDFSSAEAAARWRELTGPIADATELTFTSSLFSAGSAIDVELSSNNITHLRAAADRLKAELRRYPGVFEVADSFRPGKQEIKLAIKPEAEAVGLSLADLARQVRQAFYGEEAQRVQRAREEIKVMVRYPQSERRSLADVENMRIRTPDGSEVPFSTVADVEFGRGYATIQRADRRRVINVTADVDAKTTNANQVLADIGASLLPQLVSDYPGLRYSMEGEQREQRETMGALVRGMLISLLVIYALMAIPLASYLQPLIVMTAIPYGVIGAIWAHMLLGIDVSFMSMFGIVALVGVVVNDSLVLVDYVNRRRAQGDSVAVAAFESGSARFRPILLTSLTTFAGLTPLLLERSLQAQFLIPMAVSLGFGVLLSTGVSLVLVPCIYLIIDDLKPWFDRTVLRRRPLEPADSPSPHVAGEPSRGDL